MKFRYIFLSIVLMILILRFFVIDICKVSGNSMASTLYHNDWLVFVRRGLFFHDPKRLDIHVIKTDPRNRFEFNGFIIKRLVGMPGEHISFEDSLVKINGCLIGNPDSVRFDYTIPGTVVSYEKLVKVLPSTVTLNYSRYKSGFVLDLTSEERKSICQSLGLPVKYLTILKDQTSGSSGIHRINFYLDKDASKKTNIFPNSSDYSKSSDQMIKTENSTDIFSKQYFYMGDNRPCSTDSRNFGSIPERRIKGKVLFLLFRNHNGKIEMFKSLTKISHSAVKSHA